MLAAERLLEIEQAFATKVERIVVLEMEGETLRLIIFLKDGTNLRVVEQWQSNTLLRYSYYWLTAANRKKIGWDNAPHHQQVENFPHHKHFGEQDVKAPSYETSLDDVMFVLAQEMASKNE